MRVSGAFAFIGHSRPSSIRGPGVGPYTIPCADIAYKQSTALRSTLMASGAEFTTRALGTTASAVTYRGYSFISLMVAFFVGGLFFSTVLAGVAAVAAVGTQNALKIVSILRTVIREVYVLFTVGIQEAWRALRNNKRWNWQMAGRVLKEKMMETQRIAKEGVVAVRSQANFYAAAVGPPGLIPIQYALDRMMPYGIGALLETSLRNSLSKLKNANIRRIQLVSFQSGTKAPQLTASRIYDLENAMAFDMDIDWVSDLEIKMNIVSKLIGFKVPVMVKNVRFNGSIRIQLTPLTKEPPGYGALLVSFITVPQINMNVQVAGGEISRVPWLRTELQNEITNAVENKFLWPKRVVVVPSSSATVLTSKELQSLQKEEDPLRQAELEFGSQQPILRDYLDKQQPDKKSLRQLLRVIVRSS